MSTQFTSAITNI